MTVSQAAPEPTTRRRGRRVAVVLLVLLLVLVLAFLGAVWYISGQLIDGMTIKDYSEDFPDTVVTADEQSIALEMETPPDEDATSAGIAGVRLAGDDYLQVDRVSDTDGAVATREVIEVLGQLPATGSQARVEYNYFPGDPRRGLGLDFTEVDIDTPLGPSPAWFVPGESDTWAIFSHGRGATRNEGLRMLQTAHEVGLPTLLITFRDDLEGQPEDGISNFGMTEWPDLEAAVRYALDNGAEDVVLLAASTGGAISMAFLENSDLADSVVGMAFDAPVTSFGQTVDLGAAERGYPALLVNAGKWIGEQRVTIDFDETDYVSRVDDLDVPTLIIHGTEDTTNPIEASEEFVANAPAGVVRLEVVEGAEHMWAWNTDPERFAQVLGDHLRELTSQ